MKIESLAGVVRGEEPGDREVAEARALVVTDIRQGVKNPNRANIFIDGKYSFSLDIAQVVDLKVKIGRELSAEELAELKRASEFGKLYQRTLEWVLVRPRSERETRDYLRRKIYDKKLETGFADLIIERLAQKHYLDDAKFAAYYVENRFVKKGISRKRLKMELMKKGVGKETIEQALAASERNDEAEIKKIIAKKRGRYDDEKLTAYLCRQGFPYQLVQSLIRDYGRD